MSAQYRELRPTSGWDRSGSLRHPCKFQQVSRLGSVTARHLVVGVSQSLRRWTEGATYVRQGDHHVGHWPTYLVSLYSNAESSLLGRTPTPHPCSRVQTTSSNQSHSRPSVHWTSLVMICYARSADGWVLFWAILVRPLSRSSVCQSL